MENQNTPAAANAPRFSKRAALAIYLAITLLIFILALLAFIATRPDDFHVERSAQISAPPEAVFPLINDFHEWVKWSPYEKLDPNMQKTFTGPASGPGAVYEWSGNSNAGAGRITVLDSKPDESVAIKLEMFKPFEGTNQVRFELQPTAAGTKVSWIMDGKYIFFTKALSLVMDMDTMIGQQFDEGLANLNTVAQAKPPAGAATP